MASRKLRQGRTPDNGRIWLLLPALIVATLLAYQPAWHGGVLWDDDAHITRPELRTIEGLRHVWFNLGATQQYYPLVHSAFWLQHRVWGDNTLGYHIVNIVLHAVSAFLIALILRRLAVPGAAIAAVVFSLHPVHVESVAWITELKNTLSTVFYLGAALLYLRFDEQRRRRFYWAALVVFVLALLSKTVTATLPAALLVVFWWKRGRLGFENDVRPLLPFFVLAGATGVLTVWVERVYVGAQGFEFGLSALERLLIAGRAVCFYAAKLAWPSGLTFIYPRWQISTTDPLQYLYPLAVVTALIALWSVRQRWRAPLATALLFGGTLFPALGFVDVFPFRYSFVADHFQYLASIAPIALFSAGIALTVQRAGGRPTGALAAVSAALLLGALTRQQSAHYRDAETLFRSTLARNPACWMCHNNLGMLLLQRSEDHRAEAMSHFDQGLRINPRNPEGQNNRGVLLGRLGRHDEAIRALEAAIRLSPDYGDAHLNLGEALRAAGRDGDAYARYQEALRLTQRPVKAHRGAGLALQALGRLGEAIPHFEAAVRLDSGSSDLRDTLGTALARAGRADEARVQFESALRIDASHAAARNNLATTLAQAGRREEAVAQYEESLRLHPANAKTHDNLGYLLVQMGRRQEAAEHFEEALRLAPDYAPARVNVGNLLIEAGRPSDAIPHYLEALEHSSEVDVAQVHNHLGVAYAMTSRRDLAVVQFREALRLRPDMAEARANLARATGR